MLTADATPASDEPISLAQIVHDTTAACQHNHAALSAAAAPLFAAAASYFRIRERAAQDPRTGDARLAVLYAQAVAQMSDLAARALERTADCMDFIGGIETALYRHRDDPRDASYIALNREIRTYYDAVLAVLAAPGSAAPPPRPSRVGTYVAVGILGTALVGGLALAVRRFG